MAAKSIHSKILLASTMLFMAGCSGDDKSTQASTKSTATFTESLSSLQGVAPSAPDLEADSASPEVVKGGGSSEVIDAGAGEADEDVDATESVKESEIKYLPQDYALSSLGTTIYDALLTGNGLLGTTTYLTSDRASLRVDVGRTDLYDHRESANNRLTLFDHPRLLLGHFELGYAGGIGEAAGEMALSRGAANARLQLKGGEGVVVTSRTLATEDFVVLEIQKPDAASRVSIEWKPAPSASPRQSINPDSSYVANSGSAIHTDGDIRTYVQQMNAGGEYGLGYKQFEDEEKITLVAYTHYSRERRVAREEIVEALEGLTLDRLAKLYAAHDKAWAKQYSNSYYRIPDAGLQAFYDMQTYKFASALRVGGPALDLQGPWPASTPWPGYWWNLNIQLSYSPLYVMNRLDLASTLISILEQNKQNLINNAPERYREDSAAIGRSTGANLISNVPLTIDTVSNFRTNQSKVDTTEAELGNLTWTLYYYYQHYRFTLDKEIGRNLYDLLRRSVNYALHLTKKNAAGKYEFAVKTVSPEYPNGYDFNTNYDLAVLKWGLKALLSMNEELELKDPNAARWKDYLDNFIDYPVDERMGYKLSQNMNFTQSHRHYSHLMMIYPFYDVNVDQPEKHALIDRSINNWKEKRNAFQGYSLSGLASMDAMMGRGDQALVSIQDLLRRFIKANTLYAESGPVIETPLSLATSLNELVIQFFDGVTRIFPAVPSTWNDLEFYNFRTDGAFLISGKREAGKNNLITIVSEKGGRIKIKPNLDGVLSHSKEPVQVAPNGVYVYDMEVGEVITLTAK